MEEEYRVPAVENVVCMDTTGQGTASRRDSYICFWKEGALETALYLPTDAARRR